jgi:hypothetical protein
MGYPLTRCGRNDLHKGWNAVPATKLGRIWWDFCLGVGLEVSERRFKSCLARPQPPPMAWLHRYHMLCSSSRRSSTLKEEWIARVITFRSIHGYDLHRTEIEDAAFEVDLVKLKCAKAMQG